MANYPRGGYAQPKTRVFGSLAVSYFVITGLIVVAAIYDIGFNVVRWIGGH